MKTQSLILISLFTIAIPLSAPSAKQFNKPTCGWWLPEPNRKPIFIGECAKVTGFVTVTLPDGTVVTVPGTITVPGNDKPGHGHGDSNHTHSGPPGQNKK